MICYLQVGTYYKTPKFPIWIVCSESHFSVLFSLNKDLINDWKAEKRFDMYYYDGLARQQEVIKLTICKFYKFHEKQKVPHCQNSSKIPHSQNSSKISHCQNSSKIPHCQNSSKIPHCQNSSKIPHCQNSSKIPHCQNSSKIPHCQNSSKIQSKIVERGIIIPLIHIYMTTYFFSAWSRE